MIAGIVLAAGNSSRMGRAKALLRAGASGTESLLDRMTRILLEGGADEVVVVVGRDADAIRAALHTAARPVRLVENQNYEAGQLSSLLAGLSAVDRPGVRAVLVTPVDLPLLSADTVRAIVKAYRLTKGAAIVRPARQGHHGHPVIFDRAMFQELRRADPAMGARAVVHAHASDVVNVAVEDEGAFVDVDTPAEYEQVVMSRSSDRARG